jgi:hypothetical protein
MQMNRRELKEMVALRAVEMFAAMTVFHDDVPTERLLEPLKAAVAEWDPSIVEVQQLRERLRVPSA